MSRLRELSLRLLLALGSVAFTVALCELAVRIVAPQTVLTLEGLYVGDPEVGYRHVPGFTGRERNPEYDVRIEINSRGYRDREYALGKRDALRIVGLGDSFTFGSGVEEPEIYLSRLETLLPEKLGRAVEVVNLGAGGRGLSDEARVLAVDGPDYEPDLVLVGLFFGNDIRDVMCGWDRFRVEGGFRYWKDGILERWRHPLVPGEILRGEDEPRPLREPASAALPIPFKDLLKENLHLYTFLQRRYDALRERLASREPGGPTKSFTVFNMEALMIDPYPAELEQAWDDSRDELAKMRDWCTSRGARLAVVGIPIPAQVDPEIWDEALATYGLDPRHLDREKPQRRLEEIGRELGVPIIDLLPALLRARESAPEDRLYYRKDIHWTPRGHDVAAREIQRVILAEGLLDES
jgi:hypothetical protein